MRADQADTTSLTPKTTYEKEPQIVCKFRYYERRGTGNVGAASREAKAQLVYTKSD
jgi:hypothetical protein